MSLTSRQQILPTTAIFIIYMLMDQMLRESEIKDLESQYYAIHLASTYDNLYRREGRRDYKGGHLNCEGDNTLARPII